MIFRPGHRVIFIGPRRTTHAEEMQRTLAGHCRPITEGRMLADGQSARVGIVLTTACMVSLKPIQDSRTGQSLYPE